MNGDISLANINVLALQPFPAGALLLGNPLSDACMFVWRKERKQHLLLGNDAANRQRHKSTQNVEMKSVKFSRSVSACELSSEPTEGCVSMCGMCPPCVFAPKPPGSTRCVWRVSDEFRRRFLVELLLRCRNVQVLENIQSVLGVTSWSLFTYARSRGPSSPEEYRCSRRSTDPDPDRDLGGKQPLGMDLKEIWTWFSSSPDWMKSRYLCRLFLLCDPELLRMVANLASVLLVRQRRGFLQVDLRSCNSTQFDQATDEDSEDPALMVVPGSSKSLSGVSRYRDFIGCLPVNLSKRILGLLEEHTLRCCQKVCRYWQHLAKETVEEFKFRRKFQEQIQSIMNMCKSISTVSPTHSSIVEVPVPTKDDEEADIHSSVQKVMPFEAAYANIKTKTVRMEERNVYCGAYFTKVLLDKEDPHRVVDYRGKSFMALGSKDRAVQLFYVASETKPVSVLRGHVGSIRAVLLCEDRHLVITAGCDASIRCWNLKTDSCVMELYGHTGTINCLDVHGDRLVSGSKDSFVKGTQLEDFHFKHSSSIRCVKINATTVCSSCDRGLVKIWDMEKALLLRVIDAHKKAVKCLFFDEWHLLSGDSNGQVMAWSVSSHAKECLMTFSHPKEVKSLTLIYLRVVTGCVDGKIRIFNFVTGDCLKDITAEAESGCLMSLHFSDNSILVNSTSSMKLLQFAKMFWEGTEATAGGQGDVVARDGLVSEKSAASVRKFPSASFGADHKAQVASPSRKMRSCESKMPERAALRYHTHFLFTPTKCHTAERREAAEQLLLSEKATCERIKKRGPHHPPTRNSILLRVGAIQRAQGVDEVSVNMECNARLRDSWGPHTPQDPLRSDTQALKKSLHTQICPPQHAHHRRAKTCVPILKRGASQSVTHNTDATTAPDTTRRHRNCIFSRETQPRTANTRRMIKTAGTKERPPAPESMLTRSLPNLKYDIKTGASLPKLNSFGPAQRAGLTQAGRQRPSREGAHSGYQQMI